MTGKKTRLDAWDQRAVLPTVAKKLDLTVEPEFTRLDLVLYEIRGCPLAVAIEHENEPRGIETELDKLFLIRSRLKVVLITYAWNGDRTFAKAKNDLEQRIVKYYRYYERNTLQEPREAEYLFLLGSEDKPKSISWHQLSFDVESGPAGNEIISNAPVMKVNFGAKTPYHQLGFSRQIPTIA